MHKILFIADGSLDRPILHSQGIPLLKQLSALGHRCYILSFEEDLTVVNSSLGHDLHQSEVNWHPVLLRSNASFTERIKMITTGIFHAWKLCIKEKIEIIHARSYRPAVIASLLKILLDTGFMFDMRGFLIDEQIMLGRWKPAGVKYHFARLLERWCLLNADTIISNTSRFTQQILKFPYFTKYGDKDKIVCIPNCVNTERFKNDIVSRDLIRQQMAWENRFVLTFLGEARQWERFSDILAFFKICKQLEPSAFLAFFVYGQVDSVKQLIKQYGLSSNDYCIKTLKPEDVAAYLTASDVGFLIREDNLYIKEIPSPLKFGEYLASGLPVVVNQNVGDTGDIIRRHNVGVVIDPFNPENMLAAARKVLCLVQNDPDIRQRCHQVAEEELSLQFALKKYLHAYEIVSERRKSRRK